MKLPHLKRYVLCCAFALGFLALAGCANPLEGPEGSLNIGPALIVRGSYLLQENTCANDESELSIIQDLTTLLFRGGFDYQPGILDEFEGFVDDDGTIYFDIEEGSLSVSCIATFADDVLSGSCVTPTENCNFSYVKKTD